jgi:DNA-binding CsgD family transcriptional regulator
MTIFSANEGARLQAALSEVYALGPVETFPTRVLSVTQRLIGCKEASYNEIELSTGDYRVLVYPDDGVRAAAAPAFGHYMHEHPVIAHVAATGDPEPHAISDFLRPAEFHRLGLHGEFFRPLGIEDQLSATLHTVPGQLVVGLALDRDGPFGEFEHQLLGALRPHLAVGYQNAVLYSAALAGRGADNGSAERADARLGRLTDRQHEILGLIARGCTNAQIGRELGVRMGTVKKHVEHILERLGTGTRLGAARLYLDGTPSGYMAPWWILEGQAREPLTGSAPLTDPAPSPQPRLPVQG